MNVSTIDKKDEIVMALVHYFITEENYTPIVVRGVENEVWLEKVDGPYRIIRINSGYIHNMEQYEFDLFKTKKVMAQIKRKTLSFKMNVLNLFLDINDDIKLDSMKNISSIKVDGLDELSKNKDITEIFPKFKDKVLKEQNGMDLLINVTNDINTKTERDNKLFTKIFTPKVPLVTYILMAICTILFISMYIFGNGSEDFYTLYRFGANLKEAVLLGDFWRPLTCIFLHAGIVHFLCNMYSLYVIGRQLEGFLGKIKYFIVFIGSGLIGSLLSIVVHNRLSVGASGAIFGLLGSLVYFGYHYRLYLGTVLKTQIIPLILINLLIGFSFSNIDNFAHIGGLVGGYLLTMALGVPGKSKTSDQVNGWIVTILLVAFLVFALVRL